ncbi:hypothetical protein ACFLWX_03505 [Chloroflexota bacterium]
MRNNDSERNRHNIDGLFTLFEKSLCWFLIGKAVGFKGGNLRDCTIIGTIADCAFNLDIDVAVIQALEKAQQERERQEFINRMESIFKPNNIASISNRLESRGIQKLNREDLVGREFIKQNSGILMTDEEDKWRRIIEHPTVVLIIGKRGSGKSALGYYIIELLHIAYPTYVVGAPETAQNLLPDWVGIVPNLEMLPPNSIGLVDEAHLKYHARQSNVGVSVLMSKLLNLSRQKSQTIVFVSQEARQLDRNIVSSADVIIFKDLGLLQAEFERRELNKIAMQAKQAFNSLKGDRRGWNYIYSPYHDFVGPLKNTLPSFWGSKLSSVFANDSSQTGDAIKPAKKMTLDEKIRLAKELKKNNHSIRQIAKILVVSPGTVHNYLNDYPYFKTK